MGADPPVPPRVPHASDPMTFKRRRLSSTANNNNNKSFTGGSRPSFSSFFRRRISWAPSGYSAGGGPADDSMVSQLGHHASLPQIIPSSGGIQPLPLLPLICLCLAMLAEFLSASTPAAFLFFQIQSFYVPEGETHPPDGVESLVAFWSGIVGSVFFLSQFLTSLLWAEVEKKHGCRAVLVASLAGNAISLTLFGMSKNLASAIVARLGQGLFAGAVGVARSAVKNITVESNESQAYTLVGLAWGLGGIIGSIIGGLCEHPVKNYPALFGSSELLTKYPYLLPCLVSSSITLFGAFLCLFLGWDGGPRDGAIKLPIEKTTEEGQASSTDGEATPRPRRASLPKRISGYFNLPIQHKPSLPRDPSSHALRNPRSPSYGTTPDTDAGPSTSHHGGTPRTRPSMGGNSYGYDARRASSRPWTRRLTMDSMRRGSTATNQTQYAPDFEALQQGPDLSSLNFAQRLLLANEPTVLNISDLWVQACAAQTFDEDEESHADPDTSVFERDDDPDQSGDTSNAGDTSIEDGEDDRFLGPSSTAQGPSKAAGNGLGLGGLPLRPDRPRIVSRQSTASSRMHPRIFSNTGLKEPPALFSPMGEQPPNVQLANENTNPLTTIHEQQKRHSQLSPAQEAAPLPGTEVANKPSESIFKDLPLGIILQYFIVAFHSTACDQVFNTFLVTPVSSGGLGLTASHFAELVAALFFAQMLWQFKAYGNIGPPNGRFTHLSMLRLGMCIYIPIYLLFPALRNLLHETSDVFVMTGMIILASLRALGNVCAYTSLMVLVNIMTPPHLLGLSNALAQSTASAARFCGPVVGAIVWSWSIDVGPSGRSFPFDYHFGFVFISIACLIGLTLSLRLR